MNRYDEKKRKNDEPLLAPLQKTTKHQFAFQLDAVASRPCLALPYRQ
jgi:hypothetical protein